MILECDIGNTRCKWRLRNGVAIVDRGAFAHDEGFGELARLEDIGRVKVACVAKPKVVENLNDQLATMGLAAEMAQSTASAAGVENMYSDPTRLGVDRWVAIIAAHNRKAGASLIIDAGSALTADLVAANGQHLGGYISPGIRLMKQVLLNDTGKVRFQGGAQEQGLEFGQSTADAVNAGVLAAQLGLVQIAIDQSKRRIGKDFAILLTGGDANLFPDYLSEELQESVEIVPELVLDGLQWVLP